MSKFNMAGIAAEVRKKFKDNPELAKTIGVGNDLTQLGASDFITMPKWFQDISGVPGLPFGKIVMVAGDSDSGKTSFAIAAMKAAQAQGAGVLYVETEGKTTEKDLINWGIDTAGILLVKSSIAETAFHMMFEAWDRFKENYPGEKLLVVFDSIGNVVSKRDADIDITEQNSKPGGKGQINRLAINKMVSKRDEDKAAILVINYTYDNIGSPGKTNAGGKAVNFFSSLTFQTSRRGWAEKTVRGQKVRVGAQVTWKLFKNHLNRTFGKKESILEITNDGIECVD